MIYQYYLKFQLLKISILHFKCLQILNFINYQIPKQRYMELQVNKGNQAGQIGQNQALYAQIKDQLTKIQKIQQESCPSLAQFTNELFQAIKNKNYQEYQEQVSKVIQNYLKFPKKITEMPLCAKILEKGKKAYKCAECMLEDNSIICFQCFKPELHQGHLYELIDVFGGCCDCGDEQKWQPSGSCQHHQPLSKPIQVNAITSHDFEEKLQFAFFLLVFLHKQEKKTEFPNYSDIYGWELAKFLLNFNKDSVISNQMTVNLFRSYYSKNYGALECFQDYLQYNLLQIMLQIKKLKKTSQNLSDLFIYLCTIPGFRRQLTIQYFKKGHEDPSFLQGNFQTLSCQLFTSHKIIDSIISSKQIKPLHFFPFQNDTFEATANKFVRFYIDIKYLYSLYKDVSLKFVRYQFMEGDICVLGGYRKKAEQLHDKLGDLNPMQAYGLQSIYFDKTCKMISIVKKQPEILKKIMRDLYRYISSYKYQQNSGITAFIPQQRTLAIAIFAYLNFDFEQLKEQLVIENLIEVLGIDRQSWKVQFQKIIKRLNYVFTKYTDVLSNSKEYHNLFTFYSFTFRKEKHLFYADCALIIIFNQLAKRLSKQSFGISYFLDYLNNVQISKLANTNNLDSKLGSILVKMGLYVQLCCNNFPQLYLSIILQETKQQQMLNLYEQILCLTGPINIKQIRAVKEIFSHENAIFEKFIKYSTIQSNRNIRLKPEIDSTPINVRYFISKTRQLSTIVQNRRPLSQTPNVDRKLFNDIFTNQAIQVYLQLIQSLSKLIQQQKASFIKNYLLNFVDELLKLYYIVPDNQSIKFFLIELSQNDKMVEIYSGEQIKQLKLLTSSTPIEQQNDQERKKKIAKITKQKIDELKLKMQKVSSKMINEENVEEQSQITDQQEDICMYCREGVTSTNKSLMYLCFLQRSNLYTELLSHIGNQSNMVFSSCYHMIHHQCFVSTFQERDYYNCVICKAPANILLPNMNRKSKGTLINKQIQEIYLKRIQIMDVIIKQKNSEYEKQKKMIQEQKQHPSLQQQLYFALMTSFLLFCCSDPKYFLKKNVKIYKNLLDFLKISVSSEQLVNSIKRLNERRKNQYQKLLFHTQLQQSIRRAEEFFNVVFISILLKQQSINFSSTLPEIWQINIKIYLFFLFYEQEQLPAIMDIPQLIQVTQEACVKLPQKLSDLIKQSGKCPNCSDIKGWIFKCLLCNNYKTCRGCSVENVMNHTAKVHNGTSVFVKIQTGLILLISGGRGYAQVSIYQNYLGQPYQPTRNEKIQGFFLNFNSYEQLKKKLFKCQVQQQIRYQEKINNKGVNTHNL